MSGIARKIYKLLKTDGNYDEIKKNFKILFEKEKDLSLKNTYDFHVNEKNEKKHIVLSNFDLVRLNLFQYSYLVDNKKVLEFLSESGISFGNNLEIIRSNRLLEGGLENLIIIFLSIKLFISFIFLCVFILILLDRYIQIGIFNVERDNVEILLTIIEIVFFNTKMVIGVLPDKFPGINYLRHLNNQYDDKILPNLLFVGSITLSLYFRFVHIFCSKEKFLKYKNIFFYFNEKSKISLVSFYLHYFVFGIPKRINNVLPLEFRLLKLRSTIKGLRRENQKKNILYRNDVEKNQMEKKELMESKEIMKKKVDELHSVVDNHKKENKKLSEKSVLQIEELSKSKKILKKQREDIKKLEKEKENQKMEFQNILESLKSEKESIIEKNQQKIKSLKIKKESIIEKNLRKIKRILQKKKHRERDIEVYFRNQKELRFTSLIDYKVMELVGGKIGRNDEKKGVNGFVYKIELGGKYYAMKILRIAKKQNPKSYQMFSKNTAEILLVIKPEFLSFIPHKNIISIYHAFKEDLRKVSLKKLENVKGDEKNEVIELFNSHDLPLNKKTGFLVMEYFESNLEDLKKKRNSKFSEKEFLVILEQLLEGLYHIYCRNIVHRDIKPDNIFVKNCHYVVVELLEKNNSVDLKKMNSKSILQGINLTYGNNFLGIEIIDKKSLKVECKSEESKIELLENKVMRIMGGKCSISDPDKNRSKIRCVIGDFGCSFVCVDGFIVPKKVDNNHVHQISGNICHFPKEVHDAIKKTSIKEIDYSKSDIFAIGLTCYSIISNDDPFGGVDADKREGKDYIPIKNNFSKETKELIQKLCCVDKDERYSVEFALSNVREIRNSVKSKK